LRWADTVGAAEILKRLQTLDDNAIRYRPPTLLTDLAHRGGRFF
jgi:hypothetical protein